MYIHLVDRFEKRGREGLKSYDPAATDRALLTEPFARYGGEPSQGRSIEGEDLIEPPRRTPTKRNRQAARRSNPCFWRLRASAPWR